MIIEIWSDFVCPFCYIGKRKVEKAINKLPNKPNIKVIYKAFELNPEAPLNNSLRGSKAFAKMKGYNELQSKQMFLDVAKKASEFGLKYDMENTIPVKTYKAHRLAKWARIYKKENALTELLMDAHFVKGLNIADDDILLDFIKQLALNIDEAKEVLQTNKYHEIVDNEINEAYSLGVQGVPFFVFNRKFAVSGAAPDTHFELALQKAMDGETFETVNDFESLCGPDGCAI